MLHGKRFLIGQEQSTNEHAHFISHLVIPYPAVIKLLKRCTIGIGIDWTLLSRSEVSGRFNTHPPPQHLKKKLLGSIWIDHKSSFELQICEKSWIDSKFLSLQPQIFLRPDPFPPLHQQYSYIFHAEQLNQYGNNVNEAGIYIVYGKRTTYFFQFNGKM